MAYFLLQLVLLFKPPLFLIQVQHFFRSINQFVHPLLCNYTTFYFLSLTTYIGDLLLKNILVFLYLILTVVLVSNTIAEDYRKWGLPDGAKLRLGKGLTSQIVYSPNGKLLAVAGSIGIWIHDVQTGEELDLLIGHTSSVRSVAFSSDGLTLASASMDNTIRLWDGRTGTLLRTMIGHTKPVWSVAFSPNGETISKW